MVYIVLYRVVMGNLIIIVHFIEVLRARILGPSFVAHHHVHHLAVIVIVILELIVFSVTVALGALVVVATALLLMWLIFLTLVVLKVEIRDFPPCEVRIMNEMAFLPSEAANRPMEVLARLGLILR